MLRKKIIKRHVINELEKLLHDYSSSPRTIRTQRRGSDKTLVISERIRLRKNFVDYLIQRNPMDIVCRLSWANQTILQARKQDYVFVQDCVVNYIKTKHFLYQVVIDA